MVPGMRIDHALVLIAVGGGLCFSPHLGPPSTCGLGFVGGQGPWARGLTGDPGLLAAGTRGRATMRATVRGAPSSLGTAGLRGMHPSLRAGGSIWLMSKVGQEEDGEGNEKKLLLPAEERHPEGLGSADGGAGGVASSSAAGGWGAVVMLNFVALLWGSQHSIIKLAVDHAIDSDASASSPGLLNLARFAIASMVFLPLSPGLWRRGSDASGLDAGQGQGIERPPSPSQDARGGAEAGTGAHDESSVLPGPPEGSGVIGQALAGPNGVWLAGAEMGTWMFLGYAFQSVGLMDTTASRSAFLLYLNVKLVPIFSCIFFGTVVTGRTWLAAAIAVVGTCLLGYDGGTPPNVGDAWCIAAAAASAMFILRLGAYSNRYDTSELNATSMVAVTLLCLGWVIATDHPESLQDLLLTGKEQVGAALYLGLVTTALTNFLQTVGQKTIAPDKAAIIYSIDPVWGAGFAYLLLGETLGEQGLVGCVFLLLATVISMLPEGQPQGSGGQDAPV